MLFRFFVLLLVPAVLGTCFTASANQNTASASQNTCGFNMGDERALVRELLEELELSTPLPDFSPAALRVLGSALRASRKQGHALIGTEHVLYGLYLTQQQAETENPRIIHWLQQKNVDVGAAAKDLERRALWKPRKERKVKGFTNCMERVFQVLSQISNAKVRDGDLLYEDGLVASEFIVAAMIVEGTGVGAEIVTRLSKGVVNAFVLLQEIGCDPDKILLDISRDSFTAETVLHKSADAKDVKPIDIHPWYPDLSQLKSSHVKEETPTSESNWVIYPQLLIGSNPGTYKEDLDSLIHQTSSAGDHIGRTTFVCLMGEYRNMNGYMKNLYPKVFRDSLLGKKEQVNVVYFPIQDFEVAETSALVEFIGELKRRLLKGERLYLHCRGGHGRTGLVLIPLVAALYDFSYKEAKNWVMKSYKASERGQYYRWKLPETREQEALAEKIVPLVTKKAHRKRR